MELAAIDRRWIPWVLIGAVLVCLLCLALLAGVLFLMRRGAPQAPATDQPQPATITPLDAGIRDVRITRDLGGDQAETSFAQADVIYTHFAVEPGKERRLVEGSITSVEVPDLPPGTVLRQYEEAVTPGQAWIAFAYSLPWPLGRYRVDLVVDGASAFSAEIQVVKTNSAGARIQNVYTSRDQNGVERTSVFPRVSSVYVQFTLSEAELDTQVKGVMVARQAAGMKPDTRITDTSGELGDGAYWFEFFNEGPWPAGSYTIFIYLNGQLASQLDIQVQ